MPEQEIYVLVFNSTHAALAVRAWVLDAARRERFGDIAVIATPEAIQAGCGMSLLFSQVNGERRHALAQLGAQFEHCDMRLFRRTVSARDDTATNHDAAPSPNAASSNGVFTSSHASPSPHAATSLYTYQACEFSSLP